MTPHEPMTGALFLQSSGEKMEAWLSLSTYQVVKFTHQGQDGSACSGLSRPVNPDTPAAEAGR